MANTDAKKFFVSSLLSSSTVSLGSCIPTKRFALFLAQVLKRYPHIPAAAIDLIEQVKTCANGDETSWFLTAEDYARSGEPWPWDSFESMLLEDMDKEEQGEVRTFWDAHFPIFFSVGGEYTYMAINVDKSSKDFGSVVEADMAYYDEPGFLAQSYEKFWQDAIACLKALWHPIHQLHIT